ncbi:MAG: restriction endonuclease subunit S [Candidatus Promineifilaceae bacterium]
MSRFLLPELPKEWIAVNVGDVVNVVYGKGLRSSERVESGTIPVYASGGEVDKHNQSLHPGPSIVIGRKGTVGSIHYVDQPFWCIDTAFYLDNVKHDLINLQFLAYILQVIDLSRYVIVVGVPGINRRDIETQKIPLPPLPEQERIVGILREADELRRQQQAALTSAQTLIPALFHHLFGDPATNPKEWPVRQIGQVIELNPRIQRSQIPSAKTEVSFLPLTNIDQDWGIIARHETRTYEDVSSGYTFFQEGDVLFAKITPSMQNGKSTIAYNLKTGIGFGSTEYHVLRPTPEANSEFLLAFIRRLDFRMQAIRRFVGSAGQQRVPNNFLMRYLCPVPPPELQAYFSERVKEIRAEIEEPARKSLEEFENLFLSLLSRVFSGELTEPYRQNNMDVLQMVASERDAILGHVRHVITPIIEEKVDVAGALMGRDTLAHSLSLSQRTLLQTIVTYLTENGQRYFTLSGFLDDHNNLPVNAVRQNVELLEKVGLLTRVSQQVAPEGIPYFETFYRLTTPLAREAAA